MIRPETLLQSNQAIDADFRAPVRLQAKQLHCGLGMNGYYCEPSWIQKFAKYKVFVAVLATLGLLQGAAMGYFTATAYTVAKNFGFSHELVNWILVSNEISQGIFGLVVSYWGGRGNRPGWIAICATFQALTCFLLMLPYLVHETASTYAFNTTIGEFRGEPICYANLTATLNTDYDVDSCYFTLVLMFFVQLGAGLGGIAVLSHGLAYIDDNVEKGNSAALIGEVICLRHLGPYVGLILAWRCLGIYSGPLDVEPSENSPQWIGAWWLGWPILSTLLFVLAILVAMFPSQLPSQAVKEMAASIVDLARGVRIQIPEDPILSKTGFFWSLRRLFTNKIIILNTLATVCLQTAMSNYLALEDKYLESKFYIPRVTEGAGGFQDPWTSRLVISLLRPPLVALHIMVMGLVISKMKMRAGRLTMWHVIIALSVAIFMFSRISTTCSSLDIQGEANGSLQPLMTCNSNCRCASSTPFSPVCSQEGSLLYYSACHAGCSSVEYVDDVKLYARCRCVQEHLGNSSYHKAKSGSCYNPDCNVSWILNQCFTVMTAALVGTRLVGNVIIIFRNVQPQDKSVAVGLELTLVGLVAYVPGKILYQLMAESACLYRGRNDSECKLYDAEKFGLYLNVTTGCLMILCAILSFAVWFFSRDLDFYIDDDDGFIEMQDLGRKKDSKLSSRQATPAIKRRKKDEPAEEEEDNTATVQEEVDHMRQPVPGGFGYNFLDISDHMDDDSLGVPSPTRRQQEVTVY